MDVHAPDHGFMLLVLAYLVEGSAKSGEIAEKLGVNRKHVSVVLSRCFRRGLVSRKPYKWGRVRGFIYGLTEKGANWLLHIASKRKAGPEVVPEPRKKVVPRVIPVFRQAPEARPESLDDEVIRDMAFIQGFANINRPCGDNSSLLISEIVRHDEEEASLFFLHREEEKRRDETEKALVEILRENRKLFRELVRSLWTTRKSVSSRDFELGRAFGRLEEAGNRLVEAEKKLSSLQLEKSVQATREVEAKQSSIITSAAGSAMDRWWDILPSQHAGFENILESIPNERQSLR